MKPGLHRLAVAAAVSLILFVGCSGSQNTDGNVTVTIKDLKFNPPVLTVPAGTTVTWVNKDTTAHTSTSDDFDPEAQTNPPQAWNSTVLDPGQSWSRKFDTPGGYDYGCSIHPYIKGTVKVTGK